MAGTQATSSAKGYLFQSYFGIFFVFEGQNYKKIKTIKLEAAEEDIVITYRDGTKDFIQVKTHENPNLNVKFDGTKFKKGMTTLYTAYNKAIEEGITIKRLIYANNMKNQGIKKLTKFIEDGSERNFIYNLFSDFTEKETSGITKKLPFNLPQNTYLARVQDTYFISEDNILPELKNTLDKAKIASHHNIIYDRLKVIFSENATNKNLEIDIRYIAWIFIQKSSILSNLYPLFNSLYAEKLLSLGYFEIKDIISEEELLRFGENNSDYLELHQHLEKIIIDYKNKYLKIDPKNLFPFIEYGASEFEKSEYLNLDEYQESEKIIIYAFLFYYTYRKNKDNIEVYNEFELGEIRK